MPDVKSSRPYSSPVREEQAARTRARIVQAADELFCERGYARTTMKDIAERAEVSRDTVHAVFGTKAALILAMVDARLVPDGSVRNVADTPAAQAVRHEPDPERQLELFADFITRLNVVLRPVFAVVRGAAANEPELVETLASLERNRMGNMELYAGWFSATGKLRMGRKKAAQTIFAIVSPDVGRMLCDELGWSQRQHADWVADLLKQALLPGRASG